MDIQEGKIGDKEFYSFTTECLSPFGSDEQLTIVYYPGEGTDSERGLEGYYAVSASTATGPDQSLLIETGDMVEFVQTLLELHDVATAVRAGMLVEECSGEASVLADEVERLNARVAELEAQLGEGEEE
jgi:hypothetical protein